MKKEITTSEKYTLNWRDGGKALIVAVLTPVLFIVQKSIEQGELTFDWKTILMAGLSGGIGYIIKNFFSPSVIQIKTEK